MEQYSEEKEMDDYIREWLKVPPLERMRDVERSVERWYALMPPKAKRAFEKLRWGDITEKFE